MVENGAQRVAVIGGGVAGLSVAHELIKRGFSVTVFERRQQVGGKAASSECDGLPAEHGFRFFPGFYFHVIETMKEIPAADRPRWVADHLTELDTSVFADEEGRWMTMPLPTRTALPSWWQRIKGMSAFRESMPGAWETASFVGTLARLVCACDRRWDMQLERQSWLEHVMSSHRAREPSANYRRLFAIGLTRSFVATRAEEMNARTGGKILLQLLYDSFFGPPVRRAPDRALDGPTSDVWISPWEAFLREKKVDFKLGYEIVELDLDEDRISGLRARRVPTEADAGTQSETDAGTKPEADAGLKPEVVAGANDKSAPVSEKFDWYVLAVPCEVLKELLVRSTDLLKRDMELAKVFNLRTRWMNGIVFGVDRELDPPLPKGHMLCLDSQWALTLLDQAKVWSDDNLVEVLKQWKTLLSVDISDWNSPGRLGLPAKWPPTPEMIDDLWSQLQAHLPQLRGLSRPKNYNLDFDIQYTRPPTTAAADEQVRFVQKRTNNEPLLVNTPGSWSSRPGAKTTVANLFVAGDFARTHTNFASMEAANEAARRAVNELLRTTSPPLEQHRFDGAEGRPCRRCGLEEAQHECPIEPLQDPDVWWFSAPQRIARRVDDVIFRWGLPIDTPFRLPIAAWMLLGLVATATGTIRARQLGR